MNKKFILITINLILFLILNVAFSCFSQIGKQPPSIIDSTHYNDYYLEMKGTIQRYVGAADIDEDKLPPVEAATITIFEGSKVYLKLETNSKGKCDFRLPLEHIFKIQVSKNGFVSKYFEVKTVVPKTNFGKYEFNFNLDIFEEIKNMDVSVLKKPIGKVFFDPDNKRFEYDDIYSSEVNLTSKQLYKNYFELEQARIDSAKKHNISVKANLQK